MSSAHYHKAFALISGQSQIEGSIETRASPKFAHYATYISWTDIIAGSKHGAVPLTKMQKV